MDADLYQEAIEYEQLTKQIYQEILTKEGVNTIAVQHDVSLAGRSGVEHQVDVFWEFKQASVTHRTLIECKNYNSSLTLEKVRNFFAVLHDIGNCSGIMVTKTGYQSGTAAFAKYYGINLKLLRKPTDEDWKGRIKTVHVSLTARVPISTKERPIICSLYLGPNSTEQETRLREAQAKDPQRLQGSPSTQFLGSDGQLIGDEMRWWLPRQLDVLKHPDGGPYQQRIELKDHYLEYDLGNGPELVKVLGALVEFYVETLDTREIVIDASETIASILKDFESGEIEYAQRKD